MVSYEERGRVALITIRRPEARNAVNGDVATGIEDAVDKLEANPDVWVGVLTGEGSVFSAGADLKALAGGDAAGLNTARGGFAGIVRRDRAKPIVAAVNGPAFAGGCEIALACDLIVAARSAAFGLPEVKRALVAAAGGLFRLPRVIGTKAAMEAILTGDPIPAERAQQLGLVNVVADDDAVIDEAVALAERIAANAPLAVQASRRVVLAADSGADDDELWRLSNEGIATMFTTEDFAEGPRAFIEKRPPQWKGR